MKIVAVIAAAVAFAGAQKVLAADHTNIEEGAPTQIEDAYPLAYGDREVQGVLRYDRTKDGKNRLVLDPRLEFGIARNAQFKLSAPLIGGNADRRNSGDVGAEFFYNFNQESLSVPALAASVRADLPTGKESQGLDTTWKLIATKSLGASEALQRLHLNLSWKNNASPRPDERRNFYVAAVGYSQRAGPDTVFVTDLVREQERERDQQMTLAEVGLRRQLTPLTALSAGIGTRLAGSSESPRLRITFALQHSF